MRNPNEIWDDTHIRRNVSMKLSLSNEADQRMMEIRHIDNFSEYVRRLIVLDIEHHILDNRVTAKIINFLENEPDMVPFWRKKIL